MPRREPKPGETIYSTRYGIGTFVDWSNEPSIKALRELGVPEEPGYTVDWQNEKFEPHNLTIEEIKWNKTEGRWEEK